MIETFFLPKAVLKHFAASITIIGLALSEIATSDVACS